MVCCSFVLASQVLQPEGIDVAAAEGTHDKVPPPTHPDVPSKLGIVAD